MVNAILQSYERLGMREIIKILYLRRLLYMCIYIYIIVMNYRIRTGSKERSAGQTRKEIRQCEYADANTVARRAGGGGTGWDASVCYLISISCRNLGATRCFVIRSIITHCIMHRDEPRARVTAWMR